MFSFSFSKCVSSLAMFLAVALMPAVAAAQQSRDSRVQVTVVDPTGGVVPGVTVTLVGLEPVTQAVTIPPAKTNEKGVATIEGVVVGRYSIRAEFPGFDIGLLRDIRTRAGESRHVVVLPLPTLSDTVVVTNNTQETASDRRTTEFGLKMSDEQINALSDDPAEMQRQLAELAGPDAIFRVDSFEGQQLPPKAQIKSIHVTRDQFAAEAANPGSTFVDIITQPGIGPLRGQANLSFRDGSMSGKSQFTATKGPEQTKIFNGNIGGTLVEGRTSFTAGFNLQDQFTTPIVNVVLPSGQRSETLGLRQPVAVFNGNFLVDHALTKDQTLRVGININHNDQQNLGVGAYDLPERAFSRVQTNVNLRLQEAGPIGRRSFINTRFSLNKIRFDIGSETEAPTIIVLDSFTSGGAQQKQNVSAHLVQFASDIDHVRGKHSWRTGVQVDAALFGASSSFNYMGTYTFADLDGYNAGKPIVYSRSLGTPRIDYYNVQGAVYLQDDIRVRRGLTFSPGVRYTLQTDVSDRSAVAPRFGFTWSPTARGRTTLRGSAGLFHGFLPLEMLEQSLRLNGEAQREIYISDPSYPNPGAADVLSSRTSKYVIGDFNLQRNLRYSAGIDQVLSPRVRFNALYNYIHLQQQPRGENVNAIVDGVRPDSRYGNVIEAVTDTEIRRHEVFVNWIVNFAAPSPTLNQALFNWKRMNMNLGYSWIHARNNSNGQWAVPQTGNIADDWGPGGQDSPYRVQVLLTSTQLRNLTANVTYLANAGTPYTLTTGLDDNLDGFVSDRPAGVGLRSLRGAGQSNFNIRAQYALPMGGRPQAPAAGGPAGQARYRMNLFVNIQNLTNRQNLGGYSGVMTSPFFLQPTLAANPRRVDLGVGVTF